MNNDYIPEILPEHPDFYKDDEHKRVAIIRTKIYSIDVIIEQELGAAGNKIGSPKVWNKNLSESDFSKAINEHIELMEEIDYYVECVLFYKSRLTEGHIDPNFEIEYEKVER